MAKSKSITADEYVTAKLVETEEKLKEANSYIKSLEEYLDAFQLNIMIIRKVFKVELSSTGTEYKIVCYKDPKNEWNNKILEWSGSLKEEEFKDEFKYLMKVLHLKLPDKEDPEDLVNLDDLNEVK